MPYTVYSPMPDGMFAGWQFVESPWDGRQVQALLLLDSPPTILIDSFSVDMVAMTYYQRQSIEASIKANRVGCSAHLSFGPGTSMAGIVCQLDWLLTRPMPNYQAKYELAERLACRAADLGHVELAQDIMIIAEQVRVKIPERLTDLRGNYLPRGYI